MQTEKPKNDGGQAKNAAPMMGTTVPATQTKPAPNFDGLPNDLRAAAVRVADLLAEIEGGRQAESKLRQRIGELEAAYDTAVAAQGAAVVDQMMSDKGGTEIRLDSQAAIKVKADLDTSTAAVPAIEARNRERQAALKPALKDLRTAMNRYDTELMQAFRDKVEAAVALLNEAIRGSYALHRTLDGSNSRYLYDELRRLRLRNTRNSRSFQIAAMIPKLGEAWSTDHVWQKDSEASALHERLSPLAELTRSAERLLDADRAR